MLKKITNLLFLVIGFLAIYKGSIFFYIFSLVIGLILLKPIIDSTLKNHYWLKIINYISFLFLIGTNLTKTNFNNIYNTNVISIIMLIYFIINILVNSNNKKSNWLKLLLYIIIYTFIFSILVISRNMNLYYLIFIIFISISTYLISKILDKLIGKHKFLNDFNWESFIGTILIEGILSTLYCILILDSIQNIVILFITNLFFSLLVYLGLIFGNIFNKKFEIYGCFLFATILFTTLINFI